MTFEQFVKVYAEDVRPRLRETTWRSKEYMINEKLIPFFGEMRVVDIISKEVMGWQNGLLRAKDENGKKFSETYIRTVENQLSAILNHAVRHYGLPSNPLQKAGSPRGTSLCRKACRRGAPQGGVQPSVLLCKLEGVGPFESPAATAASALLTQSDRLLASTPRPRATSA